jgi:alpha-D-xyloside xylohydrolase
MLKRVLISTCVLFLAAIFTHTYGQSVYTKTADGVIVNLPKRTSRSIHLLQLQVISDRIIHVKATPDNAFSTAKSLMAVDRPNTHVNFTVAQSGNELLLSTASIIAHVSLRQGTVNFTNKTGKTILSEKSPCGFTPQSTNGEKYYHILQAFNSPADEAFYGLGQHQNGIVNYKNQHVELLQNNTEVAVPFMVSNKNYGILWDNYSITKVGDTRDYRPLSDLKLYGANNSTGYLTATYTQKKDTNNVFVKRNETEIDYSFLSSLKNFPAGYKLGDGKVTWAGAIESTENGTHQFLLKYAGYAKVWINGKLLADRWRQSWNPGTALIDIDLVKGQKYPIRVEWLPDGDESYIALKWLSPLSDQQKQQFTFDSEAGKQLDYYFITGKNIDQVISGYRTITGKAAIMPQWAMGFWQSRERYKTQGEILNTVKEFRDRKIPLDNIVEDWSYWKEDQWGSQEFDETRFPDPKGMISTLHDQYHTHFMISVWAKFYEGIDSYKYFDENGWLYKQNVLNRQRDWIGKGYVSTFYDAYNPKARDAFWNLIDKHLYTKGVDAWWMDASEPDINSNMDIPSRKAVMTPTFLGSSTLYYNGFPLQNAKGIYEGQRKSNPDKRVFILTRSAYAGLQRYAAATWSGDIGARWSDMKNQIPAGINFALSGIPYWTMDIGGFAVEQRYEKPNAKDLEEWREQMTRWYQFGAFVPLFRVHGQFPYREMYNVAPENHPAYQSMLYYDKLRYRLMPYIYSLAGMAYHKDYTLMRGLIMDYEQDEQVKNISDEYLFGPDLLVNPVYAYGARSRSVYLPKGNGWYDLYSGKYSNGGQTIAADAPYERMPIYVKEGSIVPFGPEIQYTGEKPADPITLYVYTGMDASFTLYEDEGNNYNYEKGAFSNIRFTYTEADKTLTIGAREGKFAGMLSSRKFNVVYVNKNHPVGLNFQSNNNLSINYEGKRITRKINQ